MAKVIQRVFICNFAIFLVLTLPGVLSAAEPVSIAAVRNAASLSPSAQSVRPWDGPALALGSIFTAFGAGLGPVELVTGALPYPTQLPADPGGTRVTFRSVESGEVFEAYLMHAWQSQVSGIVPSDLPLGPAKFTISYDGLESDPMQIEIVETDPGIFTISQTGLGAGVIQNYESPVLQPINGLSRPVAPGQYIILWGTGLGAIDGPDNIAPPVGNVRENVQIRIGSVMVPAEYAGRAPGFPGVDQYNVRIPDDGSVETGCYIPVSINANIAFSRSVTIAISDKPGECDHPWNLSPAKLAELDEGGTAIFMTANLLPDSAFVGMAKADRFGVSQRLHPEAQMRSGDFSLIRPVPNGCASDPFEGLAFHVGDVIWTEAPSSVLDPPSPVLSPFDELAFHVGGVIRVDAPRFPLNLLSPGVSPVDFGGSLRLENTSLKTLDFEPIDLQGTLFRASVSQGDDFFDHGPWKLAADGGADVPPFEIDIRREFDLAELLPETVSVGDDLVLAWDGSAFGGHDEIVLFATQPTVDDLGVPQFGATLSCRVSATSGTFTISAQNLAVFSTSLGSEIQWQVVAGTSPQVVAVEGVDHAEVGFNSFAAATVTVVE